MSWADSYIEKLINGESVSFRPSGQSMTPLIKSGQLVTISPETINIKVNDIVLCKVGGFVYLHLVKGIKSSMKVKNGKRTCVYQYLIGNNHGKINGWTTVVYGKLVDKERTSE